MGPLLTQIKRLIVFHFGCLPFLSSSILVIFHFGRLPFWSSSILAFLHFGRLPFWSSSILVVFHFGRLPFWSSSILSEIVFYFGLGRLLFVVRSSSILGHLPFGRLLFGSPM